MGRLRPRAKVGRIISSGILEARGRVGRIISSEVLRRREAGDGGQSKDQTEGAEGE